MLYLGNVYESTFPPFLPPINFSPLAQSSGSLVLDCPFKAYKITEKEFLRCQICHLECRMESSVCKMEHSVDIKRCSGNSLLH